MIGGEGVDWWFRCMGIEGECVGAMYVNVGVG